MPQFLSSIAFLCLLALPLAAQDEALIGTWEGSIVQDNLGEVAFRLTFEADGVCKMIAFLPDDFFEIPPELSELVPPIQGLSAHVTGTYRTEGDSLWIEGDEVGQFVGDQPAVEFFTEIARGLARAVADAGGMPEEDYPAFEAEYIAGFVGGFLERQLARYDLFVAYEIEGDALAMTTTTEEGDGAISTFHRVDSVTAVAPTTWGRLKEAWRP